MATLDLFWRQRMELPSFRRRPESSSFVKRLSQQSVDSRTFDCTPSLAQRCRVAVWRVSHAGNARARVLWSRRRSGAGHRHSAAWSPPCQQFLQRLQQQGALLVAADGDAQVLLDPRQPEVANDDAALPQSRREFAGVVLRVTDEDEVGG